MKTVHELIPIERERLAKQLLLYATQYTDVMTIDEAIAHLSREVGLTEDCLRRYARQLRIIR